MADAARRWADALAAWAIPQEILDAAPESPWWFASAVEALPPGGTVIDVGCGGGAGSLALVPPAWLVIGVDSSDAMLDALAGHAAESGVTHREVAGCWPDVAPAAGAADVAVCHHVTDNVAAIVPFLSALTAAARRRVVVEMTTVHPQSTPDALCLWFHGLRRPTRHRSTSSTCCAR